MAINDKPVSAPLGAAAAEGVGRVDADAGPFAATGAGAGVASSWRSFTVGRGVSGVDGFAAATCTREVSCFGFGASAARPMMAVVRFDSSTGVMGDAGLPAGAPRGAEPRPVRPGGRLIRTVSFFESSADLISSGFSSAMASPRTKAKHTLQPATLSIGFSLDRDHEGNRYTIKCPPRDHARGHAGLWQRDREDPAKSSIYHVRLRQCNSGGVPPIPQVSLG
jgi:hypothetical protein